MREDRTSAKLRRRRYGSLAIALLAALSLQTATAEVVITETTTDEPGPQGYPRTIEKIWYRTGKERGFIGRKHSGDLMITRDSLEFLSKKADITVPVESIEMVSFGKMRGDVNTDWVVLTIRDGTVQRLIGFRDGRKMGYGARTPEIFETVLDIAEELSWGQFAAPAKLEPYTELDHVFAVAVPQGWSSYHHEMISTEGSVFWGTVVFTPEPMTSDAAETHLEGTERELALEAIQRGETTAWVIRRVESRSGMSCEGFTQKALKTLAGWVARDPFLGVPFEAPTSTVFEPETVGGCRGVRASLRAQGSMAPVPLIELRVVSQGDATLILGLRTTERDREADLELFEAALPTVKFAITR